MPNSGAASVFRRPLYLLLVVALVAIAAWGFWPRPLAVETTRIARAPLAVAFTEEGRTRLRKRYTISAPLDGIVERIALEPGDPVQAGATLAVLRPANASLLDPATRAEAVARWRASGDEVAAATAAVVAARAERERSRAALARAESLSSQRLVARQELDAARATATAADASLRAAEAHARAASIQRELARAVLDLQGKAASAGTRLDLKAPSHGRIVRRYVESEGPVRAGQALLDLGDPAALEVIVEVLTADAVRIAPGTQVRLLHWGGPAPLHGRVRVIEPGAFTKVSALGVEEQRVLAVVDIVEPAKDWTALGDGFRVDAEFIVWQAPSVLSVPTAALFRDGSDWAVYRVEDGRARLRHVRLGQVSDVAAELTGGLDESDEVVLYPGDRVDDGKRVSGRD